MASHSGKRRSSPSSAPLACAGEGIHTAIDTAGHPLSLPAEQALGACDLVILDVKHADPGRFRQVTGGDWRGMCKVLAFTKARPRPAWIRQVVVPGWNDCLDDIGALAALVADHPSRKRVELLPYHGLGHGHWEALGQVSPFADLSAMATEDLARLQGMLAQALA